MSKKQNNNYVCPICGKPIFKKDNFCINCGTKIVLYKACTQCKQTILSSDKYCMYCGSNQKNTVNGRTKYKLINFNVAGLNENKNEEIKEHIDSKPYVDGEENKKMFSTPTKVDDKKTHENLENISDVEIINSNDEKQKKNCKPLVILSCILLVLICSLTILFTRKINITYVNDEGTSNTNPTVYKFTDFKVQLKDISKKGYDFLGWYMYKNDEEFTLYSLGVDLLFGGDLTLYAAFEPIEYKITYDANGGTNYNNNPQTYTIGTYAYLFEPTKNGYIFEGWYDDSGNQILVIDGSQKTGNLKLTAKWRKDYNGEYSYKSSTYSQSAIGSITINGDNVKVRDYPSATYGNKIGLVHKGHSYDVYEIEQNENYTWYKIGDSMWIPDMDLG